MTAELHSQHFSVRGKRRRPRNMQEKQLQPEQIELVERMALDIFADMVNAGRTFQEALGAIYLSGLDHALGVENDRSQGGDAHGGVRSVRRENRMARG